MKPKTYLGDGVYAQLTNRGNLWITTEDGVGITNTIILEPEVMAALTRYLETGEIHG